MDLSPVLQHLVATVLTGFVPVAALLAGRLALGRAERRWGPPGEASVVLPLALGWGVLSHGALLLGAAHGATGIRFFSSAGAWVAIALLALVSGPATVRLLIERAWRRWHASAERPAAAVAAAAILATVLAPWLVVSWAPSFLYDVLEYHLPEARWAATTGGFAPMPGNIYSLMPQGAEALFAFGSLLGDDGAPRIVHFFLMLTTLLTASAVARELGAGPWLRLLAALALLAHPVVVHVQADAYADLAPALYATAALLCWLRARRAPNRLDPVLAAVFLGFVFSAKYPAVGVAVLPFLLVLAPGVPRAALPGWIARRPAAVRWGLTAAALGAIAGAVYLPWLVRALLADGSPFPPLTVPASGFSPEALALRRFMAWAHRTELPTAQAYARALWNGIGSLGTWLALAVAILAVLPRVGARLRLPALWVATGYLVWNCAHDKIDRFLMPLLPTAAALAVALAAALRPACARLAERLTRQGGSPLSRIAPHLWAAAALPLLCWAAPRVYFQTIEIVRPLPGQEASPFHAAYEAGTGALPRPAFLGRTLGSVTATLCNTLSDALAQTAAKRGGAARALLVYEARVECVVPPGHVTANTVFDPSPLWQLVAGEHGDDPTWVLAQLRERGFTHLAVNEAELARLVFTYPAREAWADPAFAAAHRQVETAGRPINAAMLAFRRYYPPHYYYAPGGDTAAADRRLEAFFRYVLSERPTLWQTDVQGMRLWVSAL